MGYWLLGIQSYGEGVLGTRYSYLLGGGPGYWVFRAMGRGSWLLGIQNYGEGVLGTRYSELWGGGPGY